MIQIHDSLNGRRRVCSTFTSEQRSLLSVFVRKVAYLSMCDLAVSPVDNVILRPLTAAIPVAAPTGVLIRRDLNWVDKIGFKICSTRKYKMSYAHTEIPRRADRWKGISKWYMARVQVHNVQAQEIHDSTTATIQRTHIRHVIMRTISGYLATPQVGGLEAARRVLLRGRRGAGRATG